MPYARQNSRKLCIVLANSDPPNFSFYNVQEIGLAKSLETLGWSVDILVYSRRRGGSVKKIRTETWGSVYEYDGVSLPGHQAVSVSLLRWVAHHADEYSIFQVHDCTQLLSILAAYVVRRSGGRCVLYQGMYRDHAGILKTPIQKIYNQFLLPVLFGSISDAVGKTDSAIRYLQQRGLPARVKPKVVPVGLDVSAFSLADTGSVPVVRDIDVLYIGKLDARRAVGFFVTLLKQLCNSIGNIRICVVGDGPDLPWFLAEMSNEIARGNLIHERCVANTDVWRYYSRAKVFVFPTRYEIFGMAMLEAMHFGACVVASPEAGPIEAIEHERTGYLCSLSDVERWRVIIANLLADDAARMKVAKAAELSARSKFDWGISARLFADLYGDSSTAK